MILDSLQNWKGAVDIDGVVYDSIEDARHNALQSTNNTNSIILLVNKKNATENVTENVTSTVDVTNNIRITVKQYMTKPSTPEFDFMSTWNNNIPMPLRTMVGQVEKETKGMVYMKLHGDITSRTVQTCMKCGKAITNPVSQFFGMGPECGSHNYVSPFESEEELQMVVDNYRKNYLQKITWEGWVIKSAIIKQEVI